MKGTLPTARQIASTIAEALAPGSAMVMSVGSGDEEIGDRLAREYQAGSFYNHSPKTTAGFFQGFVLQPRDSSAPMAGSQGALLNQRSTAEAGF